jgi:hypothetical protein
MVSWCKTVLKEYGMDYTKFPSEIKNHGMYNHKMWLDAKVRQLKKQELMTGLDKALESQLEVAGEDLYTKINQFTVKRKETHERLKTLIRARLLRHKKHITGEEADKARKIFPKTHAEKAAVMMVLGPYPSTGKADDEKMQGQVFQYSECCSQVFTWTKPEGAERYNLMIGEKKDPMGRTRFWNANHLCGQTHDKTECRIPNHALTSPPYNLDLGNKIEAKI